jgi:hypothetical protein
MQIGERARPNREWPAAAHARRMRAVLRRTLIVSLAALLLAAPAGAGTIIVKLHFVPGKLVVKSAPATIAPGMPVQVPLTIADGRGSGNGWTLRTSTAVAVSGITVRCASNSTCTLPKVTSVPWGKLVLTAARATGMGIMNVVVTLSAAKRSALSFTVS